MPEDAPLASALDRVLAAPGAPFSLPDHKRAAWLDDPFLALDVPYVPGVEDQQLSTGVLARAQRLAADLWHAEHCRFSVGGSTMANQALALAVARPGDRVAVARTVHKSLFAGLVLAGLEPVWMQPQVDERTGLTAGLPVAEVERALAQGVSAVFVVEPSYTGVLSDVEAIARLAHGAGVPLVVDQAWGAHLGLGGAMPRNAIQCGADAAVVSVHKTLTAFTQAALVLFGGDRIDERRVDAAFEALNTTSPSATIYASIDRSRALMAARGDELLDRALALAGRVRAALAAVPGVELLDDRLVARHPSAAARDPLKLVVSLAGTGADGFAVQHDLARDGVTLEMADRDTLVPILTVADDDAAADRLVAALTRSVEHRRGAPRPVTASIAARVPPQTALSPREAFFAPSELVPASAAVGRVSAELAAPYPPGIPALVPGELVTAELLEALQREAGAGTTIRYCADPSLRRVLVVA
ncbi:MAG TPA: aminotransferase class V-fold PLP-dependent enzyme [Solirubrobacteraceae bacterium]|jgi:lysine decarboxylase|nr:aminotransferase class V-fold PLP-dependent enzyme [Solirubrobacteraceae bacterium]